MRNLLSILGTVVSSGFGVFRDLASSRGSSQEETAVLSGADPEADRFVPFVEHAQLLRLGLFWLEMQ